MPQLILEYSSNLLEKDNLPELLKEYNKTLTQMLPTELSNCKSRAIEYPVYCIGDGSEKNAFVHINLKILSGRVFERLQKVGQRMMEMLKEFLTESSQELNLKLSVEIDELKKTYFKN